MENLFSRWMLNFPQDESATVVTIPRRIHTYLDARSIFWIEMMNARSTHIHMRRRGKQGGAGAGAEPSPPSHGRVKVKVQSRESESKSKSKECGEIKWRPTVHHTSAPFRREQTDREMVTHSPTKPRAIFFLSF
jgi:hypothetical protein